MLDTVQDGERRLDNVVLKRLHDDLGKVVDRAKPLSWTGRLRPRDTCAPSRDKQLDSGAPDANRRQVGLIQIGSVTAAQSERRTMTGWG